MGFKREKIVFQGVEGMPKYWKPYFSMSETGQEYVILWNDEDKKGLGETLIMSDTEYEWKTNEILFDAIKEGDEILSLGYGIGLIVPEVEKRGGKLTVIEKYQEIINLEENLSENIEIVMGDANEIKYKELFRDRKFDIIFSDLTEVLQTKIELDKLLKEDGEFIYWKHL